MGNLYGLKGASRQHEGRTRSAARPPGAATSAGPGQSSQEFGECSRRLVVELSADVLLDRARVNLPGARLRRAALFGDDDPLAAAVIVAGLAGNQSFAFEPVEQPRQV